MPPNEYITEWVLCSTDTDENVIEHGTSNGNFILLFIFDSFDVWAVVKLNLPFVNKFMPEPVHFFVVSGRCGTAISRHNLETLVQSSNGQFKVQSLTEWYLHWKVTPRMNVLVIFAMVEIHADWKTAIPVEREVNQLILGLKDNTFADFNPLLKLSLIRIWR